MYTTYIESVCRHVSHTTVLRSTIALRRGFLSLKIIVQNRTMSKLSFRARALDANKSLPVYHADDVPDLPDIASVNRVVPQMPTGMEKEEETVRKIELFSYLNSEKKLVLVGQEGWSKLRRLIMRE